MIIGCRQCGICRRSGRSTQFSGSGGPVRIRSAPASCPCLYLPPARKRMRWMPRREPDARQHGSSAGFCRNGSYHDRFLPVHGSGRCSRSDSRGTYREGLGEVAVLGEASHPESEGPAQSACSVMLVSAATVKSLLSAALCVPILTNVIRKWLISLCAHVSPQRCFVPVARRCTEFHPLMRNSPDSSRTTNQ